MNLGGLMGASSLAVTAQEGGLTPEPPEKPAPDSE
jgi:hypothetical protein